MITLTRKMFTMVLSVVVYDHKLTLGQWAGAGIVFAGISVEAWVKRKGECRFIIRVRWRLIYYSRDPCEACRTGEGEGKNQILIDYIRLKLSLISFNH